MSGESAGAPLADAPATAHALTLGVVLERRAAMSTWIDHVWSAHAVLHPPPDAARGASLGTTPEGGVLVYAGEVEMELHRVETSGYRDNLVGETPVVWIALREEGEGEPPSPIGATPDPAEGEAFTEIGAAVVDAVPMPRGVAAELAAFTAANFVERDFHKRKRDRADPEALARRGPAGGDGRRRGSGDDDD